MDDLNKDDIIAYIKSTFSGNNKMKMRSILFVFDVYNLWIRCRIFFNVKPDETEGLKRYLHSYKQFRQQMIETKLKGSQH